MAVLYEVPPGCWKPEVGIVGSLDPYAPLIEISQPNLEGPITITDLEGSTRMGAEIRRLGFAVIQMNPNWAADAETTYWLARDFFDLPQDTKARFEHPGYTRRSSLPGRNMEISQLPDSNDRFMAGGNRDRPDVDDSLVVDLKRAMGKCLTAGREVFFKLMEQEAEIPDADPFFGRVARRKIACDQESYHQLNYFGHDQPNDIREAGVPLQVPHIDGTVVTILSAMGAGGRLAPGLTVELPDKTWALLIPKPDEAVVSFQMNLANEAPPLKHYVSNPHTYEQRQEIGRISSTLFFNPDAGQSQVPKNIYKQVFDDAQAAFDKQETNGETTH